MELNQLQDFQCITNCILSWLNLNSKELLSLLNQSLVFPGLDPVTIIRRQ